MSSEDNAVGGRLVSVNVSASTMAYFQRILALGALDGPRGDVQPNRRLADALRAFHVILAGGEVKVDVINAGSVDIERELRVLLAAGIQEANDINDQADVEISAIP